MNGQVIKQQEQSAMGIIGDQAQLGRLSGLVEDVVQRCRAMGADEVQVSASVDAGLNVNVRMGEVETIESTHDRGLSVSVLFGNCAGSASTADLEATSIERTIEQACAIARHTEPDAANGLPDAGLLATQFPDLDLWHPWDITAPEAVELALRIEAAGRDVDPRISNSDGADVQLGGSVGVYGNSLGFLGQQRGTRHTLSCSLLASDAAGMQRDYWYDTACSAEDLAAAETIGAEAARRTLARLGGRSLSTRQCPVLFTPAVARSLIGHFIGAVSGGALYRRSSFLLDQLGEQIFPSFVDIDEQPHLQRGLGSTAFDSEGVATRAAPLLEAGVLSRYVLGSYAARRLGLQSTGNAGGVSNLVVRGGAEDFDALLRQMDRGLVVTELMGQGASILTGDYSRGASGFWVENGQIVHPVEEVTIAANLRDMYAGVIALGNDIDRRSRIHVGSLLTERMTVGGQ